MKFFSTRLTRFYFALIVPAVIFTAAGCYVFPRAKEQFKADYFPYDRKQKCTIVHNWNQYFATQLNPVLNPKIDLFELKLDGYGELYPDDDILNAITDLDFKRDLKTSDVENLNFYRLFWTHPPRLVKNIDTLKVSDPVRYDFYKEMLRLAGLKNTDSFVQKWQDHFLPRWMESLHNKLKETGKDSIVFFVHGYNVPYSLAYVQCIELIKLTSHLGVDTSKYLFVPVYWPSNDLKAHELDTGKFDTHNAIGFANKKGWERYSNRAYYSAFTLRSILNELDSAYNVRIMSHSLGATLATTALINTHTKLQTDYTLVRQVAPECLSQTNMDKLHVEDSITYDFVQSMRTIPIPDRPVKVFMNAPAIPGNTTFCDMEKNVAHNTLLYVGWNPRDEMVSKSLIPIIGKPWRNGSTTFGANSYNQDCETLEVDAVAEIFRGFGVRKNFISLRSGTQKDHDILSYFRQSCFRDLLKQFFNVS